MRPRVLMAATTSDGAHRSHARVKREHTPATNHARAPCRSARPFVSARRRGRVLRGSPALPGAEPRHERVERAVGFLRQASEPRDLGLCCAACARAQPRDAARERVLRQR